MPAVIKDILKKNCRNLGIKTNNNQRGEKVKQSEHQGLTPLSVLASQTA